MRLLIAVITVCAVVCRAVHNESMTEEPYCLNNGLLLYGKNSTLICFCAGLGYFGDRCQYQCPMVQPPNCVNETSCAGQWDPDCIRV